MPGLSSHFPTLVSLAVVLTSDGGFAGVAAVAQDLTQQKLAEQLLRVAHLVQSRRISANLLLFRQRGRHAYPSPWSRIEFVPLPVATI